MHQRQQKQDKTKKSEDLGRSQRDKAHLQYLIGEEANPHPHSQKKREIIKTRQGVADVFAKFYQDFYEGEEDDTGKGTDSRTEEDEKDLGQHNSIPEFTKK